MAIPNKSALQKFSFFQNGKPFCNVTTKDSINVNAFIYRYNGDLWYGYNGTDLPVITGNIKAILKVTTPHIIRFIGVDMAHAGG